MEQQDGQLLGKTHRQQNIGNIRNGKFYGNKTLNQSSIPALVD